MPRFMKQRLFLKVITVLVVFVLLGCFQNKNYVFATEDAKEYTEEILDTDDDILETVKSDDDIKSDVIENKITVGDINLEGMTKAEAKQAVADHVASLQAKVVTLNICSETFKTTVGDLGFTWSNPDILAIAIGEEKAVGNIIVQYKSDKDIKNNKAHYDFKYSYSEEAVAQFVSNNCKPFVVEARNASATRSSGGFIVTEHVVGRLVDTDTAVAQLNSALADWNGEDITINVATSEVMPQITSDAFADMNHVLGTYTTNFSEAEDNKKINIGVAAKKINGHYYQNGETISALALMSPVSAAGGYAVGQAFSQGNIVDSIGGGICQVSTTMYNAGLLAELQIGTRRNHSMTVNYVDYARDATVFAESNLDFTMINNTGSAIYLEAYTSGDTLTITIYGRETRPANRSIKYVSETISKEFLPSPNYDIIEDNSLKQGEYKIVQIVYPKVVAKLWKEVYVDGVMTERDLVNTSNYNAARGKFRVGPNTQLTVDASGKVVAVDVVSGGSTSATTATSATVASTTADETTASTDSTATKEHTSTEESTLELSSEE